MFFYMLWGGSLFAYTWIPGSGPGMTERERESVCTCVTFLSDYTRWRRSGLGMTIQIEKIPPMWAGIFIGLVVIPCWLK